ncbi:MAG: hypothetical protein GXO07_02290 [Crenarchaeota archaeon]|nr:hypothetical protein [Thermoproteota archaeon]
MVARLRRDAVSLTLLASAALMLASVISSPFSAGLHWSLSPVAIVAFTNSVAAAYLASVTRSKRARYLAPLGLLPLYDQNLLWILGFAVASFSAFKALKGERLAAGGIAVAYLHLSLWPVMSCRALMGYLAALIYAVSLNSLPRTFRDRPSGPLSYLSLALTALLYLDERLLSASLLAYFAAARYYKLPRYCSAARSAGGVAGRGLFYYCSGHAFAALSSLHPFFFKGLALFHSLALGFVSIHIFTRLPTMIPPMLGIPNARRYTSAPFVLSALSSALWPVSKHAAWILYTLAFASALYVFLPNPFKRGQR